MSRVTVVFIATALLLGAQSVAVADVFDWVAARGVKSSLSDACEEDPACLKDLDDQFDACLEKSDFLKYMNAPTSEEDKYLDSTFDYIMSCIVDENGEPWFAMPEDDA